MPKKKPTPAQQERAKQIRRLKSAVYRAKKQGYTFDTSPIPEKATAKRLAKITSQDIRKQGYKLTETGEKEYYSPYKARQQAAQKAKQTISEKLKDPIYAKEYQLKHKIASLASQEKRQKKNWFRARTLASMHTIGEQGKKYEQQWKQEVEKLGSIRRQITEQRKALTELKKPAPENRHIIEKDDYIIDKDTGEVLREPLPQISPSEPKKDYSITEEEYRRLDEKYDIGLYDEPQEDEYNYRSTYEIEESLKAANEAVEKLDEMFEKLNKPSEPVLSEEDYVIDAQTGEVYGLKSELSSFQTDIEEGLETGRYEYDIEGDQIMDNHGEPIAYIREDSEGHENFIPYDHAEYSNLVEHKISSAIDSLTYSVSEFFHEIVNNQIATEGANSFYSRMGENIENFEGLIDDVIRYVDYNSLISSANHLLWLLTDGNPTSDQAKRLQDAIDDDRPLRGRTKH